MPFGQIKLVYLLVMEFLGVDNCVGIEIEFFPESNEGEVVFETFHPVVECGNWDLRFVFTLHGKDLLEY